MKSKFKNIKPGLAIMLMTITVWFLGDYVECELSDISLEAHAQTGTINLIENSNFEVGTGHGWGLGGNSVPQKHPLSEMVDSTTSAFGSSSIKLPLNSQENEQILVSRIYRFKPNTQYTISLYAKSNYYGEFTAILKNSFEQPWGPGDSAEEVFLENNNVWTRFNFSMTTTADSNCSYYLMILPKMQGAPLGSYIWVDAIQIEEGALTDYSPITTVEVGILTDKKGNVFYEDEPVLARFVVHNAGSETNSLIHYNVIDYYNQTVRNDFFNINLPANSTGEEIIDLNLGKRGSFKIESWVEGMEQSVDEAIISVIPRPHTMGVNENSIFGTHTSFNPYALELMQKIGMKWNRSLSTGRLLRRIKI